MSMVVLVHRCALYIRVAQVHRTHGCLTVAVRALSALLCTPKWLF